MIRYHSFHPYVPQLSHAFRLTELIAVQVAPRGRVFAPHELKGQACPRCGALVQPLRLIQQER